MTKSKSRWVEALTAIIILAWSAATSAGTFMAGAASADITPDVNKWEVNSIGYFSQKVMTGVNDRVFCAALAVSDGESEAVVVTCDLMGTPPVLRQKVLAGLEGTGINDHNLLISCSHTHSGPGNMMPNLIARLGFGPYIEELTQWTADRIVAAVNEARFSMRPAVIKVAETELYDVTRNRRDPGGSYSYETRRFTDAYDPDNPENITDPTLTVIKIGGADGKTIALLFHFATHGTVLGAENLDLSADWVGPARARVQEAMSGAVVMYMNGAEGDQAPAMNVDDHSDLEYLDIIGGKVADGVLSIVDKAQPISGVPVRSIMERRKVPAKSWNIVIDLGDRSFNLKLPKSLLEHYFPEMPLQTVRIGDVVFMALPLEPVAEIGLALKAGAKGQGVPYPLVAGLANDHALYAATPEQFERGGYEVQNTVYGKMEAGILIGEQMLLVRQLLREQD